MAIVLSDKWHNFSLRSFHMTAGSALVAAILFFCVFSYVMDNTIWFLGTVSHKEWGRQTQMFYLNKGWPTRWNLLYYLLLNMFQTLIRPSSGAIDYLLRCVGWLEACWCYVVGLSVGDVVSECRLNHYTRIPHHQQTIRLHNTSTPQVSLHNTTSSRKLLKMDVLTSETCWAVDNKASVI